MQVSDFSLFKAGQLISLFFAANIISYLFIEFISKKLQIQRGQQFKFLIFPKHQLAIILGMFFLGLLPYIIAGLNDPNYYRFLIAGRGDTPWVLGAENPLAYAGNAQNTFYWIARALLVASAVLSGAYIRRGTNKLFRLILFFVFISVFLLVYFDQATRSVLALIVIPPFGYFVIKSSYSETTANPGRLLALSVVIGLGLVLITQVQLVYRKSRNISAVVNTSLSSLAPKTQNDFYTETAYAIDAKNKSSNLDTYESPMWLFITNPVPRVLWPDKPRPEVIWFYSYYRRGVDIWKTGGNALPSVVGQYYIILGSLGVVWGGILFGIIVGWLGKILNNSQSVEATMFSLSGMAYIFVSFRYFGPGFHYSTIILGLLILFYYGLNKRNRGTRTTLGQ